MRIVPERVTVIPNAQSNELSVIMEGFRLTLNAEEARTLSYALVQGMKQLSDPAGRAFLPAQNPASPAFSSKPGPAAAGQDAGKPKADEPGNEIVRSLSA